MASVTKSFVTILALIFLLCSSSSALKCWQSDLMNRMDVTKVIEEKECSNTDKSCMAETYSVGRMWYQKMGCSKDDKDECTAMAKGEGDKAGDSFICNCKTDFCNGGLMKAAPASLALMCLAVAVALVHG